MDRMSQKSLVALSSVPVSSLVKFLLLQNHFGSLKRGAGCLRYMRLYPLARTFDRMEDCSGISPRRTLRSLVRKSIYYLICVTIRAPVETGEKNYFSDQAEVV